MTAQMELNFSGAFGVTASVPGPAMLIAAQKNSIIIPISQVREQLQGNQNT